jgi:hypothetical protein
MISDVNYTHRINHLSFGDVVHGVVSPLDGEEKVTTDSMYCSISILQHSYLNIVMKDNTTF